MAFAVIPVGGRVSIFGHLTALQITDFPVAVLWILACSSFGVYGLVLAGWSSGSTYPLLGGAALGGPGDLVRGRDGPGAGRRCSCRPARCRPREIVESQHHTLWYALRAAAVVRHLPGRDGRRDQPRAVRPARGRGRAGRWLPHRVLLAEVRDVLPRRVHQHDHGLGAGHDAVPRRLAAAARSPASSTSTAGGACSGSASSCSRCCSASSGCAARCPGCATTSSCGWAGRSSSRSAWSGCSWSRAIKTARAQMSTQRPGRHRRSSIGDRRRPRQWLRGRARPAGWRQTEEEIALGGIDTTGTFPIPRLEDLLAERAPSPVAVGALAVGQAPDAAESQPADADLGAYGSGTRASSDSPEDVDRA